MGGGERGLKVLPRAQIPQAAYLSSPQPSTKLGRGLFEHGVRPLSPFRRRGNERHKFKSILI